MQIYPRLDNMSQVELSVCGALLSRVEDSSKGTEKAKFGTGSKHDNFMHVGDAHLNLLIERKTNDFLIIGIKQSHYTIL